MKYFKSKSGEVFAYESEAERNEWGAPELVEMTPEEIDAHLNPPVDPEKLADAARAQRDALLSACDWVVVRAQELGEPVPEAWADYRQALRDVPQQEGFPENIDWPYAPDNP